MSFSHWFCEFFSFHDFFVIFFFIAFDFFFSDVLDVNLFVKRLHGNIDVFAGKLLILHMNVEKHLIPAEKYVENHWKIVHRLHHLLKTINEMYVLTNVLIFVILVHVLLVWLVFYSKYLSYGKNTLDLVSRFSFFFFFPGHVRVEKLVRPEDAEHCLFATISVAFFWIVNYILVKKFVTKVPIFNLILFWPNVLNTFITNYRCLQALSGTSNPKMPM